MKEFNLNYASNDEVGHWFPEFSIETDVGIPHFEVGQLFRDVMEFRKPIRTYGALNRYNMRFKVIDGRRVQGICKCGWTWRIWASKLGDIGTIQVKSYSLKQACSRDLYNRNCNYVFLTYRYIDRFKADLKWKTKSILAIVKKDLKIKITRNVA